MTPSKKCIKYVCWALLFVFVFLGLPKMCLGHDHHDRHVYHYEVHDHVVLNQVPFDYMLWINALSSTVAISVVPFFVLFFIPIDNKDEHQSFLKILLSFASGGLLGDAFLHLIPHSLSTHHNHYDDNFEDSKYCSIPTYLPEEAHDHNNETRVGIWILAGILVFLFVEKMVRVLKGGHSHSHTTARPKEKLSDDEDDVIDENVDDVIDENVDDVIDENVDDVIDENVDDVIDENVDHAKPKHSLSVAGWLNVVADFTHNFTDGLAIGAAYLAGQNIGIVTTITVLLHEVPHEIGDYAILIQEGSTKANAMKCQLLTAVGAICGTLVSLTFGKDGEAANSWVLPFTAGGFIYIATVNVIPSLLEDSNFKQSVKEIVALLVGVYLMVLVANYE